MAEAEIMGVRLLRGFSEEALDNPQTAVVGADAARRAGFDHGSRDFEVALRWLLESGYLRPAAIVGGEGFAITSAGVERLTEE